MERGVVVGGLMVCGSFLLAALLNRSAMEEIAVSPQGGAAGASAPAIPTPVASDLPSLPDVSPPSSARCKEPGAAADPSGSTDRASKTGADLPADDLPVNVNQACAH